MSPKKRDAALEETLEQFVEEFGLWYMRAGVPRMAGRILGWLLVCDPPAQTMQEIADRLSASKASVSTMTRMLERVGLIQRTSTPGERRVRYRVEPYAFSKMWEEQLQNAKNLQGLVDHAIDAMKGTDPERQHRLEITRQFNGFYLAQLPRLIAEWDKVARKTKRP